MDYSRSLEITDQAIQRIMYGMYLLTISGDLAKYYGSGKWFEETLYHQKKLLIHVVVFTILYFTISIKRVIFYFFISQNTQRTHFFWILFHFWTWKLFTSGETMEKSFSRETLYCLNICETLNKIKLFWFYSEFRRYSNNRDLTSINLSYQVKILKYIER